MKKDYYKLNEEVLKNESLTISEKVVYTLLQNEQENNKESFYLLEDYIANEIGINEKTVRRAINKLKELGFITINRKYNKEIGRTVNYYTVNDIPLTFSIL